MVHVEGNSRDEVLTVTRKLDQFGNVGSLKNHRGDQNDANGRHRVLRLWQIIVIGVSAVKVGSYLFDQLVKEWKKVCALFALCLRHQERFAWSQVSSADLHVVENAFGFTFESYSAHHLFNSLRTAIGSPPYF